MSRRKKAPSTSKVRRDATGGKRGDGHRRKRRVQRPDPRRIRYGKPDPNVTAVAGLVGFGGFLRQLDVDHLLHSHFNRLKSRNGVIYPMGTQLRLLIDAFAVGETRIFGVEGLAADPLFTHLAGGVVPSIDTLYDDLGRFDEAALAELEEMVAEHGLARVPKVRGPFVHLDVDTSVVPIFGELEGAVPGPNPRYHGRPSFHPMLARIAETGTIAGAQLRRGDTGFGVDDVPMLCRWVKRAKNKLRRDASLCVRIDSAGDCAEVLHALHDAEAFYVIKARLTQDLFGAVTFEKNWKTMDVDAENRPTRQIAELDFCRGTWAEKGLKVRVIAVRSLERHGKQLPLIDGHDWTVQVFLTNRVDDANDIAWDYDKRAGIEPLIAECKGAWGIGHASSYSFAANHAMFLLKMLAHNLLDRYATEQFPDLPRWRTAWRRRTLLRVPGRLSRSGRVRKLHLPPGSPMLTPKRE
jgi:Transposase DDE domain group 1